MTDRSGGSAPGRCAGSKSEAPGQIRSVAPTGRSRTRSATLCRPAVQTAETRIADLHRQAERDRLAQAGRQIRTRTVSTP